MAKKKQAKQDPRYHKVLKPVGLRLNELTQSLLILRDCLELVNQGKVHHFLPIYAQLRVLLTEKSKSNKPLLLDLAEISNTPLSLAFAPLIEPPVAETVVTWVSLQLATEPDGVRQFRPLEEFLDTPVLFFSGQLYTPRKLIELFANNEGGTHFSPSRPADLTGMVQMISQPIQINLYEIAEATYKLGLKLLQSIRDIELYYILYFPDQAIAQDAYVFDMKYPSTNEYFSPLRIYCKFDVDARLIFGITDIHGATYETDGLDGVLGGASFRQLRLYAHLRNDLRTEMALYVDGSDSSSLTSTYPIDVVNNIFEYDYYINRSFQDSNGGMTLALRSMVAYVRKHSAEGVAQMAAVAAFERHHDGQTCRLFRNGQHTFSPSGASDAQIIGEVEAPVMRDVIDGDS